MYTFAVVALLSLATIKVVDFIVDWMGDSGRSLRSLLTFVISIGSVWLLDFSMFDEMGIDVRNRGVGVWVTGFLVAGFTVPWRAVFRYLTHDRATVDETLGEHRHLEKVA
jgi:hypothetical protein